MKALNERGLEEGGVLGGLGGAGRRDEGVPGFTITRERCLVSFLDIFCSLSSRCCMLSRARAPHSHSQSSAISIAVVSLGATVDVGIVAARAVEP